MQQVTPPERGSFPLDHQGECKALKEQFLACLKAHGNEHVNCKAISKLYLECRMDRGLMARDDLAKVGFGHDVTNGEMKPNPRVRFRRSYRLHRISDAAGQRGPTREQGLCRWFAHRRAEEVQSLWMVISWKWALVLGHSRPCSKFAFCRRRFLRVTTTTLCTILDDASAFPFASGSTVDALELRGVV